MELKNIQTDVLIIGGGTAGCFAAYTIAGQSDLSILIAEKANIERSGCLAAGVNALNAYITKGKTPQDYVDYAKKDAAGIVREDLLLSMSQRLNHVTSELEKLGLVILKDENGEYVARGTRNIKINGENIKPLLARAAADNKNVQVLNHVNITDLKIKENTVCGAVGFGIQDGVFYDIDARAVICATGGAAGLYRPNNPGFSRHKMWYSPFNTGAGYAMGLLAGAEMTTFEMRFVALRCKDTIAPTGTIAQGVGARQVNALGINYEQTYGITTPERVYGTVTEKREGRGPCFLATDHITEEQEQDLYRAYLNMAPSQTLRWLESQKGPSRERVEIEGTEPYIVGGHTASGYWVDESRSTTVTGLYAAGDVAGGAPQKYVTGALAEGEIAAESVIAFLKKQPLSGEQIQTASFGREKKLEYEAHLQKKDQVLRAQQVEEAMQKIMDQYAGGISTDYRYNTHSLKRAEEGIKALQKTVESLPAKDTYELMQIYEVRERLIVCRALIAHLMARKETRWAGFSNFTDYPQQDASWDKYVNSRMVEGEIKILYRDLVTGGEKLEYFDTEG